MTTDGAIPNPYVGLRPYRTDEEHLFFGRAHEAQMLFDRVFSTPLTLVYAPSGVGKSSLLQAGLAPQLEADLFTVATVDSWKPRLATQLQEVIADRFPSKRSTDWWCDTLDCYAEESGRCPVLILDQFEEALRYRLELETVWTQLRAFGTRSGRTARLVLGIREDHLAGIDRLLRGLPMLIENALHLGHMTQEALRQAFEGPPATLTPPFTVEDGLFEELMSDLRRPYPGRPEADPEPGYFQVVCRRLWELDRSNPDRRLTSAGYRTAGRAADVLSRCLQAKLEDALQLDHRRVFYAVVRYLVTPTGSKIPLTVDDLVGLVRPQDFTVQSRLQLGLGDDEDKRPLELPSLRALTEQTLEALCGGTALILRRVMRGDEVTYELFHDLLGRVLLKWREEVRTEEERDLAREVSPLRELRQQGRARLSRADEVLGTEDERKRREAVRGIGEVMLRSNVLDDEDLYHRARLSLENLRESPDRFLRSDAARTLDQFELLLGERRVPSWSRALLAGIGYLLLSSATTGLLCLATRAVIRATTTLTVPWHSYLVMLTPVVLLWAGMYLAEGFNDNLYTRPDPWHRALRAPFEPYVQGIGLFEVSSGWPFNFLISIVPAAVLAPLCALVALPFLFWFGLFVAVFTLTSLTAFNLAVIML
ncbi:hypothetical protein ACFW1A_30930 [Kitasatospora sp. NPDC058965]|uniref:nSTAND1 domain-containing NTPase n=1 Tax=Kitasatospora sp. NPDC058965 TaxID=3346682 RepID=UPI0036CF9F19